MARFPKAAWRQKKTAAALPWVCLHEPYGLKGLPAAYPNDTPTIVPGPVWIPALCPSGLQTVPLIGMVSPDKHGLASVAKITRPTGWYGVPRLCPQITGIGLSKRRTPGRLLDIADYNRPQKDIRAISVKKGYAMAKRKTLPCVLGLACLLLSGCVSDFAARYYAENKYPEVEPSRVAVLRDAPSRPFIVLADLQARGSGATDEFMREQAAQIGADAVIVSRVGGTRAHGDIWASDDSLKSTYTRVTATAIKFK